MHFLNINLSILIQSKKFQDYCLFLFWLQIVFENQKLGHLHFTFEDKKD